MLHWAAEPKPWNRVSQSVSEQYLVPGSDDLLADLRRYRHSNELGTKRKHLQLDSPNSLSGIDLFPLPFLVSLVRSSTKLKCLL